MSPPTDRSSGPPPDPTPQALQRIEEILHRYQVPPEEAEVLLDRAVQEVVWRDHPNPAARDARLVRSVERRARAFREDQLRRRLAEVAAEGNGLGGSAAVRSEIAAPEEESP